MKTSLQKVIDDLKVKKEELKIWAKEHKVALSYLGVALVGAAVGKRKGTYVGYARGKNQGYKEGMADSLDFLYTAADGSPDDKLTLNSLNGKAQLVVKAKHVDEDEL